MPKIVDHDQYRKELLEKSFDLFAEKGYASITMREIAQGLGVSTGTLYHYFPNKQALFEQLIEWLTQEDILMATTELENLQTLQERVAAIGQLMVKEEGYLLKSVSIMIDFYQHHDRDDPSLNQCIQRLDKRYIQAATDLLGIEDPSIARFILCFINGLILERLSGNEELSFTEQTVLLGKMLTSYLEQPVEKQSNHHVRSSTTTKKGKTA